MKKGILPEDRAAYVEGLLGLEFFLRYQQLYFDLRRALKKLCGIYETKTDFGRRTVRITDLLEVECWFAEAAAEMSAEDCRRRVEERLRFMSVSNQQAAEK
jgi:hypothetical protein